MPLRTQITGVGCRSSDSAWGAVIWAFSPGSDGSGRAREALRELCRSGLRRRRRRPEQVAIFEESKPSKETIGAAWSRTKNPSKSYSAQAATKRPPSNHGRLPRREWRGRKALLAASTNAAWESRTIRFSPSIWLTRAINGGDLLACHNLATLYETELNRSDLAAILRAEVRRRGLNPPICDPPL